jgi:hypothetical protein
LILPELFDNFKGEYNFTEKRVSDRIVRCYNNNMFNNVNNFILIKYIIEKPTTTKIVVAILGFVFGLFVPFAMPDAKFVLPWKILLIAIPFWTLGFAFFFTIGRLYYKKQKTDNIFKKYDVRNFFILAFYYFVPHGLSSLLAFKTMNIHENGLGLFAIAGGVSVYLSVKISQILIK